MLSTDDRQDLADFLEEVREKKAELEASDSRRTSRWSKEMQALETQEHKLLALRYAAEGKSVRQIAKQLGRRTGNIQTWFGKFRDGRLGTAASEAISQLLQVWRRRRTAMMKMEVLVGLLRATLEKKVTDGQTAASWLKATFGHKYGIKITPEQAQAWLEYMPVLSKADAASFSDRDLELIIIGGSGLFPQWEAVRAKRRDSARGKGRKTGHGTSGE